MSENEIGVIYSKLNKLDVRLKAIEETRPFLREMIKRNTESNEALAQTLQEIQITMTKMNDKIDDQFEVTAQMKEDFDKAAQETNRKIEEVDNKVQKMEDKRIEDNSVLNNKIEALEDKGQFDILLFLKKNLPWIIVCLGLGVAYASAFFQF